MFGLDPVELILLVVFGFVFYFLLIRPQRNKNQSSPPTKSDVKNQRGAGSDAGEGEPTPVSDSTQIFEQETKHCPECGAEVPASKDSCPDCGHAF